MQCVSMCVCVGGGAFCEMTSGKCARRSVKCTHDPVDVVVFIQVNHAIEGSIYIMRPGRKSKCTDKKLSI